MQGKKEYPIEVLGVAQTNVAQILRTEAIMVLTAESGLSTKFGKRINYHEISKLEFKPDKFS